MADHKSATQRPLSPHLQVYAWQWTMLYSILHRASGVLLSLWTAWVVVWLAALAESPAVFQTLQACSATLVGHAVWLGFIWALCYHLLNGLRHILWDTGRGFELSHARLSGHGVCLASLLGTLLVAILEGMHHGAFQGGG